MAHHASAAGDSPHATGVTIHTEPREVLTVFGGLLALIALVSISIGLMYLINSPMLPNVVTLTTLILCDF